LQSARETLPGNLRRELKSEAKNRPPDVRIGKNGISDNLLNEIRKVLAVSRLVKVTFSQDRETRSELLCELEERLNAIAIAKVGKSATLYKDNS